MVSLGALFGAEKSSLECSLFSRELLSGKGIKTPSEGEAGCVLLRKTTLLSALRTGSMNERYFKTLQPAFLHTLSQHNCSCAFPPASPPAIPTGGSASLLHTRNVTGLPGGAPDLITFLLLLSTSVFFAGI
jgi:hypothetical protein